MRKTVTVLFADAVDGGGHDFDDLELDARAATDFYELARSTLERYGGTVERHAGDAVMAVFGVPAARDDDARRAAEAALELRVAVGSLTDPVGVTVGINTGEVLTGDGSHDEELAVGDTVVVAARLQQAARVNEILLGPTTERLLRTDVETEQQRSLTLPGRAGTVVAFPLRAIGAPTEPGPRGVFVGRDAERRILRAALDRTVQSGIVQLVTITGEAGVGKSRLVEEVLREYRGLLVVRGVCRSYGAGSMWPPLQAVDFPEWGPEGSTAARLAAIDQQRPELGGVQHVLDSMFSDGGSPMSPADLTWAIATLLSSAAEVAPLVVILEDAHAGSAALLDIVPAIISRMTAGRVLAVVTGRPELLDERPGWGRGMRHTVGLTLRPLPDEAARRMAQRLLPPDDPAAVTELLNRAGGNPLFLEQLAQARAEGTEFTAPTVMAVVAARLDRLPIHTRQILERAALVGSTGVVDDLLALAEGQPVDVVTELAQLAARDLLAVEGERWSFASELVRDAAVAGTARDERAELHQVRGLVLATRGQAAAAGFHLEQASQLLRASDPERSARLGEQAAARLAAAGLKALSGDLGAACALLERAVVLLAPTSTRRVSLLTELGRGLHFTGDLTRAATVLTEALALCSELGLVEARAHARLALIDLKRSTEPEQAYAELPGLLEEVLPALESAADDRGLSLALQLQASALQYRVRWAAMDAPLAKAVHHAQRSGDRRLLELAQSLQVGSMFHGPMPLDQARARLEELLEQPSASPSHLASVSARLAGTLALQGDCDAALTRMAEVKGTFRDLGRELSMHASAFIGGPVHLLSGHPELAVIELRAACDGLRAMGDRSFTSTLAALLAEACWRCQDHEGAAAAVALSRRLAGAGDVISQVRWRSVQAKLHAVRRNTEEALALSSQAVQLVITTDEITSQGDVLVDAAQVQRLLGNETACQVLLRDALDRYERKGAPQAATVAQALFS